MTAGAPGAAPWGTPARKIRVLTVDDSAVVRHLLRQALNDDPNIQLVGGAPNGVIALAQIPALQPDVVILDIEMPEMGGLETLRQIRRRHPHVRTIMFSTLTVRGGASTFEALALGADDYLAKGSSALTPDQSLAGLRAELSAKIKQFFIRAERQPRSAAAPLRPLPSMRPPRVLGIGVSTGGPQALAQLLPRIPASFPLPILIVQHMPPMFTRLLAERLQALCALRIEEAGEGSEIAPGRVLVAPGGYHMRVRRAGTGFAAVLDQGPQENSCRPSVDVLFRSLAENFGGDVLAVVLTGMGRDGMRGVEALKAAGACAIVQDEASSVVWGMPGAVVEAGLADRVLPLEAIAPELVRCAGTPTHGGR